MENQISNWNGFQVHGNTAELDKIVEHSGMINLDLNDITNTLSPTGKNYITVGFGETISEAFKAAADSLPVSVSKVEKLLIQFYISEKQPKMSELTAISDILNEEAVNQHIRWGISQCENVGADVKVVLLSSLSQ